ncbi:MULTISPECIES: hypothetical protein [unclassified Polaromonas]|jgi:hypothetical protein|uniref:hypothetical protein n=1 Tax=unclassified Polaromonas TaxID=2638319 RepID=UPI000BD76DB6|nr:MULTISPECIES: hypothetical protein [unclassified Polaromonas]OYY37822.1 MAG: hypothetical protein B7Y60_05245 [Polaromonas sp. 35-63-35]OYZ17994.1 MAG: hypothetical protein B7Y28_17600 [Polaromonas sp. 16-63-31]OYZ79375.1 MAG: hypothetical protein B7Y09_07355 [Polaromonas sp. 24-63-21]OZA50517.1 MAG: hypothetical protein B7X88_09565 [Polaromonas sp. 17-63-33]OZA86266.1 MAG: hypothetical protein B7X65_18245 [Polaromonas sp. 39-63-25]
MGKSGKQAAGPQGILLRGTAGQGLAATLQAVLTRLDAQDLAHCVRSTEGDDDAGHFVRISLSAEQGQAWAPGYDTLALAHRLQLDTDNQPADLTREIVAAMLMGPVAFEFPSVDELASAVRIRHNIARAARKTSLSFHTSQAERPQDCWTYKEDIGFVIRPGVSLVTALAKATQPEVSGTLYSFSCYRATEYVMLLGIAEELAHCNPALYAQLQTLWTARPIMSGPFHDVFLREQGSMEAPLPPHYFVPGDRTWFRNPDEASAEASGYEGSWVIYLGGGLFSNFWKREQPYTLADKCLEIYQWRNALYRDAEGHERIDEARVETLVAATQHDEPELERILALMQRYREPRGVYRDGGCLDTTREFARWVCPGTTDLVLPLE